jgi:hypothetical protein
MAQGRAVGKVGAGGTVHVPGDYDMVPLPGPFPDEAQPANDRPARQHRQAAAAGAAGNGTTAADADRQTTPKQSAATRLCALAEEQGLELFHDADQTAYAAVDRTDHREVWAIDSALFRSWLCRVYYVDVGKAASAQALNDALRTLQGKAQFEGPERPVHVRVAGDNAAIYLDLGDPAWRAAEITAAGWRVVERPPVYFRRPRGLLPLPLPVAGGGLDELRPFVNLPAQGGQDDPFRLLTAWLVAAVRDRGPYPVLCLHGQQGAAKSTAARVLRALIDPNAAPLRSEPRDERDLMIAATNGWVVALDNLDGVFPWLSNALCRLSTEGGFATRELYTNREETILTAMRPAILTGIEDLATRGDLLDRCILLELPAIGEDGRRTERDLWSAFELARPRLLGALLDAASGALRELPRVRLASLPRLADFAEWAVAAERSAGGTGEHFLRAYTGNRERAQETALEASPLVKPLWDLMEQCEGRGSWSAGELLDRLNHLAGEVSKARSWPKAPNILSCRLRRLAPELAAAGVAVHFDRTGRGGTRTIRIERVGNGPSAPSAPSAYGPSANGDLPYGSGPADGADGADDVFPAFSHGPRPVEEGWNPFEERGDGR